MKFWRCSICGKILAEIHGTNVPTICCGAPMTELVPGTVDASLEKHVPVVDVQGGIVKVRVGSAAHPMLPEHFIEWICLESRKGCQMRPLKPGMAPEAEFALTEGDDVVAAFAYCNLHAFWKS